jgi:hypothetical protein
MADEVGGGVIDAVAGDILRWIDFAHKLVANVSGVHHHDGRRHHKMCVNLATPGLDLLVANYFVGVPIGFVFFGELVKPCNSTVGGRCCEG